MTNRIIYPGSWLQVLWCRMTHTGIEEHVTTSTNEAGTVTTTTTYTKCLQCGHAR